MEDSLFDSFFLYVDGIVMFRLDFRCWCLISLAGNVLNTRNPVKDLYASRYVEKYVVVCWVLCISLVCNFGFYFPYKDFCLAYAAHRGPRHQRTTQTRGRNENAGIERRFVIINHFSWTCLRFRIKALLSGRLQRHEGADAPYADSSNLLPLNKTHIIYTILYYIHDIALYIFTLLYYIVLYILYYSVFYYIMLY